MFGFQSRVSPCKFLLRGRHGRELERQGRGTSPGHDGNSEQARLKLHKAYVFHATLGRG